MKCLYEDPGRLAFIFKPCFGLAGSTGISQSEAMLENYCLLRWIVNTWACRAISEWGSDSYDMMTSSNGNISALLALCAGNSSVTGEFPAQRPVTRSYDVFFDLRLNRQLSKQRSRWWFETPPCSLWRHCNDTNWSKLSMDLGSYTVLDNCHS